MWENYIRIQHCNAQIGIECEEDVKFCVYINLTFKYCIRAAMFAYAIVVCSKSSIAKMHIYI